MEAAYREGIDEYRDAKAIREALDRTRSRIAERLGDGSPTAEESGRGAGLFVATLGEVIAAMGGRLELVAHFPGRPPVRIERFDDEDKKPVDEEAVTAEVQGD